MELYKIIATSTYLLEPYTLDHIPENFKGALVDQEFNFIPPMGYTPKFSLETMKIIKDDKVVIDEIFHSYFSEAVVDIDIYILNLLGTDYEFVYSYSIDFESYETFDEYSEFALKTKDDPDGYIEKQKTMTDFALNISSTLPNDLFLVNYVSLAVIEQQLVSSPINGNCYVLKYKENNDSKLYNSDSALFQDVVTDGVTIEKASAYLTGVHYYESTIRVGMTGSLSFTNFGGFPISINMYANDLQHLVLNIANITPQPSGTTTRLFNIEPIRMYEENYPFDTNFFIAIQMTGNSTMTNVVNLLNFDITVETNDKIVSDRNFKSRGVLSILDEMFNSKITYSAADESYLSNLHVTSYMEIQKKTGSVSLKPKDFLSDLCNATGFIFNIKSNGWAELASMGDYFDNLLIPASSIIASNVKDYSEKLAISTLYSGVNVGVEPEDYDIYPYSLDWNKTLTFRQKFRGVSEIFDLTVSKTRLDVAGMLEARFLVSSQKTSNNKSYFLFDSRFLNRAADELSTPPLYNDKYIYDAFTPRDILTNNKRVLSFMFDSYFLKTLILSSDGGTPDNLIIDSVPQMNNLIIRESPTLYPIEVNFTCTIGNVDFSENILEIEHLGETIHVFVTKATTTDTDSEQKITGLKVKLT